MKLMRRVAPILIGLFLACTATVLWAVDTIPESQQGAMILKLLDAYHGNHPAAAPKKLHVVYFTPADRDPEPRYHERLEAILGDIRAFYRGGMERAGFGLETFDLARDADDKLIVHLVKGKEPEAAFPRSGFQQDSTGDLFARDTITRECRSALKAEGIALDRETVVIFCNLAAWNEQAKTFRHHSPYCGLSTRTGGLCFAVDSVIQNAADLAKQEPMLKDAEWGEESLGKFNTIFIGGIAHELGHAFSLPHCGERWDEKPLGTSLMGVGNHTYREELRSEGRGTFMAMASAMKLAGQPLFSKSDKDMTLSPKLAKSELQISTNVTRRDLAGRPGALRVEGVVKGSPPVYGVIAYFDSLRDGGYRTPAATAVPDAAGCFAIEISDLSPCRNGQLRVQFCHANGAVSERQIPFQVTTDKTLDLEQWEILKALDPLTRAVLHNDARGARSELRKIEKSRAPELAKTIAQKLTATLQDAPNPVPAAAPPGVVRLALGDARPQSSKVGWLKPAANRIPPNSQIESPLLDSGKLYATGLFAHAPSQYVFDLGGKWKTLRGAAGLHTVHQPFGSVVFIVKSDGKEVFHSPTVRGATKVNYEIDVTNVKTLELIVDDAGDGNGNDWGLWLDPTLSR